MDGREAFLLVWFAVSMGCVILVYARTKHWLPATFVAIVALYAGWASGVIA